MQYFKVLGILFAIFVVFGGVAAKTEEKGQYGDYWHGGYHGGHDGYRGGYHDGGYNGGGGYYSGRGGYSY